MMRKDFDFVMMADYEADTRELAESAAGIIAAQKFKLDQAKVLIWHILRAAGGKVRLDPVQLVRGMPDGAELRKWRDDSDMTVVFEARE